MAPRCCPPRVSGTGTQLFSSHQNFRSQARDFGGKPVSDFKAPLCTRPFTLWASWHLLGCSCLLGSPGAPCCAQGQRPGRSPVVAPTSEQEADRFPMPPHPSGSFAACLLSDVTVSPEPGPFFWPRMPFAFSLERSCEGSMPCFVSHAQTCWNSPPISECRLSDQSGPHRSQASLCSPPLGY